MIAFRADTFYSALHDLLDLSEDVEQIESRDGKGQEPLPEALANRARLVISDFLGECEGAGLTRPLERKDRFEHFGDPRRHQARFPLDTIKWELKELREAAFTDLRKRKFLRLEDTAEFAYEKAELFGPEVAEHFRKAAYDIQKAGSCYATGCYTACVFHLMRVLEHGLRALAKRLKVPFPKTFELKTWDRLIGDIEKEIQKVVLKPKTPQRSKDLEFYNSAAAQFRYFKDGWRNHVMHTRSVYDEHQAMSVMIHVREFMQHLATRLRD